MTRTRPKTDPSVRTYYLLFDGKTLLTKRPDVKVKAVQRASSAKEAREKLALRFKLTEGRLGQRLPTQASRHLPTHQPTMRDKVHRMALADAKNSEPIDLGEVLELANHVPELPGVVPVRLSVNGITLVVAVGNYVDVSAPGSILVMPHPPQALPQVPSEDRIDLTGMLD